MLVNEMALICLLSPLLGAVAARFYCHWAYARWLTIVTITVSWLFACALFRDVAFIGKAVDLYQFSWVDIGRYHFEVGFLLDSLSLMMMVIVTSVSLLVHVYSLGYMQEDANQSTYFSYVSFFTFAMLILVMANNLLFVFFGWEGVGLASYLLIGFWQTKAYPARASIKAFVVNRVGDMGLIIAMGLILLQLGDLEYANILGRGSQILGVVWHGWRWIDFICLGLFVGAMGKSAQMPLQIWLPDSMAGPTPISALIHAATMVTAGVYLVCRFAPWFELSPITLSIVLWVGFSTMILMGIVALVANDIKKVIAYSTLSQLGMMVGICGLSGYVFSLYHLATHAAFKALLFLSAGAVIIASNHEQDLRKISGMANHRTIHLSMFIGLLSMIAVPPLSGFFSKDAMLMFSAKQSLWPYVVMVGGAVLTALYSTRLYYLLFWQNRAINKTVPVGYSICWPLWILSAASIYLGYAMVPYLEVLLRSVDVGNQITVLVIKDIQDVAGFIDHALTSLPLTLTLFSVTVLTYVYWKKPSVLDRLIKRLAWGYDFITSQYGLNALFERYMVTGYQRLSIYCSEIVDSGLIDQRLVMGVSAQVKKASGPLARIANGKLYHYILVMLVALVLILLGLV